MDLSIQLIQSEIQSIQKWVSKISLLDMDSFKIIKLDMDIFQNFVYTYIFENWKLSWLFSDISKFYNPSTGYLMTFFKIISHFKFG